MSRFVIQSSLSAVLPGWYVFLLAWILQERMTRERGFFIELLTIQIRFLYIGFFINVYDSNYKHPGTKRDR